MVRDSDQKDIAGFDLETFCSRPRQRDLYRVSDFSCFYFEDDRHHLFTPAYIRKDILKDICNMYKHRFKLR